MDSVLQQAPAHVTEEQARATLEKHGGDVAKAVADLWDMPQEDEKPLTEWEERRKICADFIQARDDVTKK